MNKCMHYCLKIVVLLNTVLLLGCSNINPSESNSSMNKNQLDSINFLHLPKPPEGAILAHPTARASGTIALENNCLYIVNGEHKMLLFFPWDSNIENNNGLTQIRIKRDGKKDKILTISRQTVLSGGKFTPKNQPLPT